VKSSILSFLHVPGICTRPSFSFHSLTFRKGKQGLILRLSLPSYPRVDRYCKYRIPIYHHQNTGKYRYAGIFNVFFLSQTELENVFAASQNQMFLFYRNFPSKISPFIYFRLRRFNKQDVLVLLNQSC
jgi:hypothetical protein